MIAPSIITILKANTALVAKVSNRIYPIIEVPEVAEGSKLSAIYFSVAMFPESVKNARVGVNHTVTFLTVASTYLESWELSLALRAALDSQGGIIGAINYRFDRCTSIEDEYEFTPYNMYGQKVIFNIRTTYY